ncbi:UNVERIFIED_CONTAM: hypothetical protein FKN15_063069 [Acipenser sinensis]
MCENCAELVEVLNEISDTDSTDGLQLKKDHALRIFSYINSWTQRQCLCCFKEYKHLEVFNQVVYALINLVVTHVQALQNQLCKSCTNNTDSDWADVTQQSDEPVNVERDSNEEEGESEGQNSTESKPDSSKACGRTEDVSAKSPDAFSAWNTEEKEKLLLCVAKIFQIQFPLYTAYKHNTHPTIEDISAQESNILGSFCDMNDVEVPLHLLRYVCLFCGKHGLSLMKDCFESGTPETLPFPIAHAFITVVSNIRIWLHIPAVMQHIIPFRTYVIRYLCKLSDQELRQSAARNMADLMWSTVKEPLDTALCFDKESLDLAFKYFMSPTLTMRLAGLSQITNQLHTFNDVCNNESLVSDTETSIAKDLADWLINNNVVEHIFGPNLHIELKHCSRYIHDLFPSLIKNLDPVPLRHLLNLVSALHPSAHTEQTLYLASMLIKALWNNALAAKAQLSKQSSFASLLNTNLPMGNKKGSPAASPESSDNSDTHHSGGSDIEMDEPIMNRAKRVQQRLSDTEESMQGSSDETANSGEDASSGPGSSSGRSDGSSNEVNSSHASQSAGSPGSEVHSEDMADSEALKEEEEEEEEVERGRSPQKECRNPELRKRKSESHLGICLGEPQGATDRSGANSGTGKDLPFNPEAVSSVDNRMRMLDACSSHPEDPDHDMAEEIGPTHLSQGSQDTCISQTGDFLGEAIGKELFNCRRFIGPQHHQHHPHHHHPHHHPHEGHIVDNMLSADDVSCSSSQVSAKSEKNMADFDGEESGCEEELVQINSHAELTSHLQQHLPNLASIYHEQLSQGPTVHKHQYTGNTITDINLDNVCKKGNTLLWDLVQDEDAVPWPETRDERCSVYDKQPSVTPAAPPVQADFLFELQSTATAVAVSRSVDSLYRVFEADKLVLTTFPPVEVPIAARVQLTNLSLLAKDAACPNKQCRVTQIILKKAYAASAFSACLANYNSILDADKMALLDAPVTPGHTFGPAVDEMLHQSHRARESTKDFVRLLLKRPPPPRKPASQCHPKPQFQRKPVQQGASTLGGSARRQPATPFYGGKCPFKGPLPRQQAQAVSQIHLSEGLINEAEKLLCSLVCWFTDRQIRMRFIEGCLENLASHRWAEKELHMMKHFFENLLHYVQEVREERHKFAFACSSSANALRSMFPCLTPRVAKWVVRGAGVTEWLLDCLACLLKLVCQFAVDPADLDLAYHDVFAWSGVTENHRKRAWPGKSRKGAGDHVKGLHIPRLTEVFLSLVQGTNMIHRLISVAYTYDNLAHSWAHCCSVVKSSLADSEHLHDWLKKLTLLVPETAVRHEACNGLYKLSLSGLEGGESINRSFLLLAASTLLKFLPDAQALKPVRAEDYEDEPVLRTGCKEYFWLLCKLIDNIHVKDASQTTLLDLDALARHLADCIRREILDQQDGNIEDDGLTGLLRLATSVVKHKPPFKFSQEGQDFLKDVFNVLFLLPSLKDRHQPKCKSHSARAAAYDLLVEMVKGSVENYRLLHNSVMAQHMQSSHAPYKWDYWPHDDVRAECRFVGLTNLGATCYLASTIQQLYMIPEARQAIFTAKYAEEIKHKTTLLELQKMFTYLMSERKAYNPRPFCKTYTMDKQPLNTGEQKDMTEFFTDLITKIEEMSPDLESLDEVTIKDTLEGDNMYTCSQCGKKVRAEKRACFKKLPRILSFNTMRYTFNMVTMMKEKVNTHFSFPLRLDMTPYTEDFLMGKCDRKDGFRDEGEAKPAESYEYDLIGVTVHTGTADGGHYYSFIRDIVNPHAYKNNKWFMWQLCSSIPSTLPDPKAISLMTAKWFLDRMADDDWWPMQILIKCPNQIVRQMFQRLCIHVIQRLRPVHAHLYLQPGMEDGSDDMDGPVEDIGSRSCVTRFVKTLLSIMEHGVKPHSKHLTEYFAFLYEFAKMGEEESQFLLSLQAISIMVHFYMGTKGPENPPVEVLSEEEGEEEEEEEDILSLAEEKYRPAALEKMIALIALLVEQSRSERHLTLSQNDMAALTGGKGFPFMFQHIRDGINIRQTCNLIFSLCRYNNRLAEHIVSMLFTSIAKLTPEVIEYNPSQCLDWLAVQTPRNKLAHSWVLQNMENWVERFLLAHNYPRVRTSAAYLLVSLIPSNSFRQMFRSTRSLHIPTRDLPLSPDTTVVLHQVYNVLLGLLSRAKMYVDAVVHGTTKLVQYFSFMTYCLISKTEKLMFSSYFMDLWNLFQPKLSEPAIATNHNKQALLSFWYNVCVDCPENVRLIVQNPVVTKNIAFNYILADHDDQDVVLFNRGMLPAYYGILRMCCEQSPAFTRQLASHQNIQWAFKNLTPHASQYPGAVEELFNLMQLFVAQRPDMREEELEDIKQFKKTTISCYLRCLDGRSCWTTLIRHLTLSQNDMAALTGGKVIEYNPSQCLDWLAVQTPRNKLSHSWVLQNMENWVERFLLAHNYPRVRTSAAYLLVSLIPSNSFRQMFRSTRSLHIPTRDLPLSPDTTVVLHQVYNVLLGLLSRAKMYVDAVVHGTTKLVQYFSFMTYCLISKTEKLMFSSYFMDLWNLFQPKLSEPAIATNHNKQALLSFWYNVCVDCPENVRLIVQNPVVTKNIAFNYILADHDDQDVVLFNRGMLPAYYGILRMCCEQSPAFTRQLASHQNIQWAFKNLTPHASQYPGAVEELFNLMQLFVAQRSDMREEELEDIKQFKKTTISCYLRCLDGRSCWTTLISAFRILLETDEDRLLVVFNRGLILMTESFNTLHMMYHEATACHVTGDLVELLSIFLSVLKATRPYLQRKDVKQALIQWQERIEFAHKLLTLLNSYSPPELRNACIDVLKELVLLSPHDFLHTLVPFLQHNHCTYHHSNIPMSFGPYFPCRENIKLMGGKNNIRPPRPELNMCLLPSMVETSQSTMAKNCVKLLCEDPAFAEYIKCILMDERTFLNSNVVYTFLTCFLLKVQSQVLSVSSCANLINILVTNLINEYHNLELEFTSQRVEVCKTSIILNADLRAFILMLSVHTPKQLDPALIPTLQDLLNKCRTCLQQRNAQELEAKERTSKGANILFLIV